MKKLIIISAVIIFVTGLFLSTDCRRAVASDTNSEGYGQFINLNNQDQQRSLTDESNTVITYDKYLAHGYNVLKSGNINPNYVNMTAPILNLEALKGIGYINIIDFSQSAGSTTTEKSFHEFYKKMNASLSVEQKGVFFSGKAKSEFGVTTQIKQRDVIIKHSEVHKIKQVYNQYGSDKNLANLLSDNFKDDIKMFKDKPKGLFDKYGTHLMTSYYVGGNSEFNFKYKMSDFSEYTSVEGTAEAVYNSVSVGADYKQNSHLKNFVANSYFTFSSCGGDNISANNVDILVAQYKEWVKTIPKTPTLCAIPDDFDNCMIPIWRLVDLVDETVLSKSEKDKLVQDLQDEFDREVNTSENTLQILDGGRYISDINVYSAKDKEDALNKIPDDYFLVYLNPETATYQPADMNKDAGGDFVYVCYKRTNNLDNAIMYLRATYDNESMLSGYQAKDVDLNKGAGGDFIYLGYRKADPNPKTVMTDIGAYYGKGSSLPENWAWVYHGGGTERADLNHNAEGEYVYLVTKYEPVEETELENVEPIFWPTQSEVINDKEWVIKFSSPIDPDTVNNPNIFVTDSSGNRIDVTFFMEGNSITVKPPESGYQPKTTYTLIITNLIHSSSGEFLNAPVIMNFKTS